MHIFQCSTLDIFLQTKTKRKCLQTKYAQETIYCNYDKIKKRQGIYIIFYVVQICRKLHKFVKYYKLVAIGYEKCGKLNSF